MSARAVLIYLGLLVVAYLAGRHSKPDEVRVETKVVERVVEVERVAKVEDKTRTRTEVHRPDGTKIVRVRTEAKRASVAITDRNTDRSTEQKTEQVNRRGASVVALVGLPLADMAKGPVYGVALSKPLVGPISFGAWGLSNLTMGVSIGLEL